LSTGSSTILLIDADEQARRLIELSLRKGGYHVMGVGRLADAFDALQTHGAHLVITELGLPDGTGYDLLRAIRDQGQSDSLPVIVATESREATDKVQALESGAAEVLTKPLYIKDVLARIKLLLSRVEEQRNAAGGPDVSGEVGPTTLIELMNAIDLSRKTCAIRVTHGSLSGTLYFEGGELIDAVSEALSGQAAVNRMLTWETGSYRMRYAASTGRPRRVKRPLADILNDAVGYAATWGEAASRVGPLEKVYTVEYRSFVAQLGQLPPEVNSLIRLFDGIRSLEEAVALSEVDDLLALQMVGQLQTARILREVADTGTAVGDTFERMGTSEFQAITADHQRQGGELDSWLKEDVTRGRGVDPEEQRRRQAEEMRLAEEQRRIAEERQRAVEEQRRAHLEELRSLAEEQEKLAQERLAAENEAAEEAERIRREAAEREARLVAEAGQRAQDLADREAQLRDRMNTLSGSLKAISLSAPASGEPAATSTVALTGLSVGTATVAGLGRALDLEEARQREIDAMRRDTGAMAPPAQGEHQPLAPVTWRAATPEEPAVTPTPAAPTPVAPEEADASPAPRIEPPGPQVIAGTVAAVTAPAEAPATPGAVIREAAFSERPASHTPSAEDAFFAKTDHSHDHHDEDLYHHHESSGPNKVIWIVIAAVLLAVLGFFLLRDNKPAGPSALAVASAPDTGVDTTPPPDTAPPPPSPEELAAKALAQATDKAKLSANDVAIALANRSEDIANSIVNDRTPELPSLARRGGGAEARPPSPPPPPAASRPAPAPAIERPADAGRATQRCATSYGSKRYQDAITACAAAAQADPGNADVLAYLGLAHYEVGNAREAVSALERSLRINRRNINALGALGGARQELGDSAGAREAYERYLELNPNSRRAEEIRTILQELQ
jgi:DNA-binding response OmpR family regulator/tetratricopeptide (TPR) repeat protein